MATWSGSGRRQAVTLAALAGAVVLLLASATPAQAARSGTVMSRKLQQNRFPADAFDRSSMAGKGKGLRASGQPDPMPGLANPDLPDASNETATMEGE